MTKEEIEEIRKVYPKFSKAVACMISHPERYGVSFIADSSEILNDDAPFKIKVTKNKAKNPPNRNRKNRISVYLSDEEFESYMLLRGNKTNQEYLMELIKNGNKIF